MLLNRFIYTEHLLTTPDFSHPRCSAMAIAHGKMNSPFSFISFSLAVSDDSINVLNKVLCSF